MEARSEPVVGSPIIDVRFASGRILVLLEDGRALAAPLHWAGPRVAAMGPRERSSWEHTSDRRGVNWPSAGQTSDEGALNVWRLEQDALFEAALAELQAAGWEAETLPARSRALVALWRIVADGYNGGILQFLGNWGIAELQVARDALAAVHARATLGVVDEFLALIGPSPESAAAAGTDAAAAVSGGEFSGRPSELDQRFWDAAEELVRLVPQAYGPAPSALPGGGAEPWPATRAALRTMIDALAEPSSTEREG